MTPAPETVRADFDRIAAAGHISENDHNSYFDDFVLSHIPKNASLVLDAGCGGGRLTRLIAKKCETVVGMDLSPGMIAAAREAPGAPKNAGFFVSDFTEAVPTQTGYDAIVSVAALHHVDLHPALSHFRKILAPRGRLIVVDLFDAKSPLMLPYAAACYLHMQLIGHKLKRSKEELAAWDDHFRRDRFDRIGKIREIAKSALPGARVKVSKLWRYTLVWEKS